MDLELDDTMKAVQGDGTDKQLEQLLREDYDSKAMREKHKMNQSAADEGEHVPFGVNGATRPPMLRTRLKRFKHIEKLRLRNDGGEMAAQYSEHATLQTVNGRETVGELLGDYERISRSGAVDAAKKTRAWMKDTWVELQFGLWAQTLKHIAESYGPGVRELMGLMKFMLQMNMMIAAIWISLVIVPAVGVDGKEGLHILAQVFGALLFAKDSESSTLFYDGYSKDDVTMPITGLKLRIDIIYFGAIVCTFGGSLLIILRTLGLRLSDLAQSGGSGASASVGSMETDVARDFASMLGALDMTQNREAAQVRHGLWLTAVFLEPRPLAGADGPRSASNEGRRLQNSRQDVRKKMEVKRPTISHDSSILCGRSVHLFGRAILVDSLEIVGLCRAGWRWTQSGRLRLLSTPTGRRRQFTGLGSSLASSCRSRSSLAMSMGWSPC